MLYIIGNMKLTEEQHEYFFDQIMYAMYRLTHGSITKHVPVEAIQRLMPKDIGTQKVYLKNFTKVLKDTIKIGYLVEHKTRGGMTYQFSKQGRDYALALI